MGRARVWGCRPPYRWAARLSGGEYKAYWESHGASGEYLAHINTHQAYGNTLSLVATGLGLVMLAMVLFVFPLHIGPTGVPLHIGPTGTPSKSVNAVLSISTVVVVVALGAVTAYYVFKTGDAGARVTHPDISGG